MITQWPNDLLCIILAAIRNICNKMVMLDHKEFYRK